MHGLEHLSRLSGNLPLLELTAQVYLSYHCRPIVTITYHKKLGGEKSFTSGSTNLLFILAKTLRFSILIIYFFKTSTSGSVFKKKKKCFVFTFGE